MNNSQTNQNQITQKLFGKRKSELENFWCCQTKQSQFSTLSHRRTLRSPIDISKDEPKYLTGFVRNGNHF